MKVYCSVLMFFSFVVVALFAAMSMSGRYEPASGAAMVGGCVLWTGALIGRCVLEVADRSASGHSPQNR